jgi:hypothetical protein
MATPPTFTAGQVLTAAQMNKGGQWLVASAAFTTAGTVNVDNVFTSDYRNYRIDIEITATTGAGAQVISTQLRTGGTAATAANYYYQRSGYSWSAGTIQADVGNAATYWFIARSNGSGSINGASSSSITIMSPQLAAPTWFTGTIADGSYAGSVGGYHSLSTAYDGFNIATTTGGTTITGVYRVYGLRD